MMIFSTLTSLICLGKRRLVVMNKNFEGYPFEVVADELRFYEGVKRVYSGYSRILTSVKPFIIKVSFPSSVLAIEDEALGGCTSLETIDFNEGL